MHRTVVDDKPGQWATDEPAGSAPAVTPAAFGALLLLLVMSPLMRGGNRHVVMVLLEAVAIALLAFVSARAGRIRRLSRREWIIGFILLSPAWLTVIYLLPVIPSDMWNAMPGRAVYAEMLGKVGIARGASLPLSVVPDATLVSLLSGCFLAAAFVAGYLTNATQLKTALTVLVAVAFAEIAFGLLQASGGQTSRFYFGGITGRPFGTFANPNHFANYLAMALVAYILLAWNALTAPRKWRDKRAQSSRPGMLLLAGSGGVLLLVGILMSRSRAGALSALAAGAVTLIILLAFASRSRRKSWRGTTLLAALAVLAGLALVGMDFLLVRFNIEELQRDLPLRAIQATTTFEGAAQFWPWGAGWGTYYSVYPRFQPPNLIGVADYAHHDYAQMLFEGGIFAVILMAAVGYLLVTRAIELVRAAVRHRKLNHDEMTSAVCGIGLLAFLLHSLGEFNMHIPANAIVACLLAGAYLRPLNGQSPGASTSGGSDHD